MNPETKSRLHRLHARRLRDLIECICQVRRTERPNSVVHVYMTQPAGLSEGDINSNEESLFVKEPLLPSTKTIANSPLLAGKSKQSYKQPWPQPNSSECRRVLRTAIVLQLTTFKNSRIAISCVELYEHRVALELYFGLPTLPRGQLPYYTVYRSGLTTTCGCHFGFVCKKKPTKLERFSSRFSREESS